MMMAPSIATVTEADINRFLAGKRLSGCPARGRYRRDVSLVTINQPNAPSTSAFTDVGMSVCRDCGDLQFHSLAVVARWLEQQRRTWEMDKHAIHRGSACEALGLAQMDDPRTRFTALAAVFFIVLTAALLLHRYGDAELRTRPTMAAIE